MNQPDQPVEPTEAPQPSFSWAHFVANRTLNFVLVALFWGAALISLIKFFFSEDVLGGLISLFFAIANSVIAFHKYQSILRGMVLYLGSIALLILVNNPDNVVSFCFLAVSLSFLISDRKLLKRIPYLAIALIGGYVITLGGVAFLASRARDMSVLYPQLGAFLVVVLLFKDLFLPRPAPKLQTLEVLRLSEFGLTKRELQIVHFAWRGLSSKEIAVELSLSEGRVRNQFSQIYRKLKIPGLAELRVLAHSHEIIVEESDKPHLPDETKTKN